MSTHKDTFFEADPLTVRQRYDSAVASLYEITQVVMQVGKDLLAHDFKCFFERNPNVISVRWCQYTPYYHDDECGLFKVCTDSTNLVIEGSLTKQEATEAAEDAKELLDDTNPDVLDTHFGDATITVFRGQTDEDAPRFEVH